MCHYTFTGHVYDLIFICRVGVRWMPSKWLQFQPLGINFICAMAMKFQTPPAEFVKIKSGTFELNHYLFPFVSQRVFFFLCQNPTKVNNMSQDKAENWTQTMYNCNMECQHTRCQHFFLTVGCEMHTIWYGCTLKQHTHLSNIVEYYSNNLVSCGC